ncbi:hypothetical protein AXG93_1390s1140 [Marchantia polymorpha subsp. ruderalis]|uniref:Uncharacterized protein n=1 Tax=Marchantia polymorpha subsp. ruderalis TaxID=1480154 RepID=A0A176W993_MARPO|nr:hypothetical protein AXG93_1390s1140 [Marchantia polymorpha subsp. ruderalis]
MSMPVLRYGTRSLEVEVQSRPLPVTGRSCFDSRRRRVQISGTRVVSGRISASSELAWTGTGPVEARNAEGATESRSKDGGPFSMTGYLDDRLMDAVNTAGGPVRQIVLMTDGTDTRPYRLNWPSPCVIFDLSPVHMHDTTLRKMADDNDDEDWGQKLSRMGYSGEKPSVWVLEMRNAFFEGCLKKILPVASSFLMKDSLFMGVVPATICTEVETRACLKRLFASNGFLAEFEVHRMVESQWTVEGSGKETSNLSEPLLVFFSTRQLRLSDSQVEFARMQIMMAEEAGDEDGFEDAWFALRSEYYRS